MSAFSQLSRRREYVHMKHGMYFGILHLFTDICTDHVDFLGRIAQLMGKELVQEALEAFHNLQVIPCADFFLSSQVIGLVYFKALLANHRSIFFRPLIQSREQATYQMFVGCPGSHRQYQLLVNNFREACIFDPTFKKCSRTGLHVSPAGSIQKGATSFHARMIFPQRSIGRRILHIQVDKFTVASRLRESAGKCTCLASFFYECAYYAG